MESHASEKDQHFHQLYGQRKWQTYTILTLNCNLNFDTSCPLQTIVDDCFYVILKFLEFLEKRIRNKLKPTTLNETLYVMKYIEMNLNYVFLFPFSIYKVLAVLGEIGLHCCTQNSQNSIETQTKLFQEDSLMLLHCLPFSQVKCTSYILSSLFTCNLLHSEQPELYKFLAVLSEIDLHCSLRSAKTP